MKFLKQILAAGIVLAPGVTAAAGPDAYLLGVVGAEPNRIAITALSMPNPPGSAASDRSFLQTQYFETPTVRGGKTLIVIASQRTVDCEKRMTKIGAIVGYDEQGALVSRGQGNGESTVPPARSIDEKMVAAACSGDWSKFDHVPDLPLTIARTLIFGAK